MPQGRSTIPLQLRRAGAVIALCALAAIGLRARGAFASAADSWAARAAGSALYDLFGVAIGVATVAVLVVLGLLAHLRRLRLKHDPASGNPNVRRWTRLLLTLFALAIVGGPLSLFLRNVLHRHGLQALRLRLGLRPPAATPVSRNPYTGGSWPVVTGMVLAVVALIIAAVVVRRRRAAALLPEESAEPDGQTALRDALSAGAAAMRNVADPRRAIIACYAAMEQHLASAGAQPAASDTPAEVLARAAAGGLVRSTAAAELTGLFRQARYGRRDMAEAERATAEDALAQLRSDLAPVLSKATP